MDFHPRINGIALLGCLLLESQSERISYHLYLSLFSQLRVRIKRCLHRALSARFQLKKSIAKRCSPLRIFYVYFDDVVKLMLY